MLGNTYNGGGSMTYEEATEGVEVTKQEALREIARHGLPTDEFLAECGERDTYNSIEVLAWMGY
jgi:hypothetical protein